MKIESILLLCALVSLSACKSAPEPSKDDYTEKMAVEHKDDKPVANAATSNVELEGTATVYATIAEKDVTGFLVEPSDVKGQMIVIHEWWGLNDNIRAMATKLAQETNYRVLAVDLYGGAWAVDPDKAKALMGNAMKKPEDAKANLRAAYDFLKGKGDHKIGVLGWCFGGHWSLQAAIAMPTELQATVIYYGRLIDDEKVLAPIAMPVLGIFGSEDKGIPLASVKKFEDTMKKLDKSIEVIVYDGADHAFANPSGTHYQKVSADLAWAKTLAFLKANLEN